MKVLFSTTGAMGHFLPMAPLAAALCAEGGDVAFATSWDFTDRVEEYGFRSIGIGLQGAALVEENRAEAERRRGLVGVESSANEFLHLLRWGRRESVRTRLADLARIAAEQAFDLIVYEQTELSAPLVSAITGVPAVEHGLGVPPALTARRIIGQGIAPLWRSRGLDPPPFGGFIEGPYINIRPPSLSRGLPSYPHEMSMRPEPTRPRPNAPPWAPHVIPSGQPIAFVTLGTSFNEDEDQFRRILRGISDAGVSAIVSTSSIGIAGRLRREFPDFQIEHFIALSEVLPLCHLVISQGGFGTTLAAAAAGLPMLFVTSVAGLITNAQSCVDADVAILLHGAASSAEIRSATETILATDRFRSKARAVAVEVGAMPPPAAVVPRLVEIAQARARRGDDA